MIPASTQFINAEQNFHGEPRYVITIANRYEIPWSDIVSVGDLNASRAYDFDDVPSGSFSFTLDNASLKYSPGNLKFVFGIKSWWYLLNIKVELAYYIQNTSAFHKVTMFEGFITSWSVIKRKGSGSRDKAPLQVEIQANSLTFLLGQRLIGRTDSDGTLNPAVYGRVIQPAEDMNDEYLWTPDSTAGAETGDTSEFDDVVETNTGTFTASTTEKRTGSYSFKSDCPAASDQSYAEIDLSDPNTYIAMGTASFKFTAIDAPGANSPQFFQLVDNSNTIQAYITPGIDGELFPNLVQPKNLGKKLFANINKNFRNFGAGNGH